MSSSIRYVIFLLWLSYLLICAILLFTRGFLVNRNVLHKKALCTVSSTCELSDISQTAESSSLEVQQFCIQQKLKLKAVIIIIDALRYDFVEFSGNLSDLEPYHNKLTVINELVSSKKARLFKFIADPPTVTFQRIHGLTTGSLPTFIDIGSNFATTEIEEDNIIDQFLSQGMKVVFMGDDTWSKIYPRRFHRAFPYPSFNVWDLDTVDNGIKKNLIPEMKNGDWDVIIAHFLGVDHCGHTYGARHPEMARKLSEMNEVIEEVANEMDNSTILFVFGDHGMTENGDHGGISLEEVRSALFIYSKREEVLSQFLDEDQVYQVDLVPTLANLLQTPIPFSSVGRTFFIPSNDNLYSKKCSLLGLWSNVNQVTHYIREYSNNKWSPFPRSTLERLFRSYDILKLKFESNMIDKDTFIHEAREYLKNVRELCQSVWIQFDTYSMSRGLVLMFLTLALGYIIVDGLQGMLFKDIIEGSCLWVVLIGFGFSFLSTLVLYNFSWVSNFDLTLYFITCTVSIGILSCIIVFNWYSVAENWYKLSKSKDALSIFSRLVALLAVIIMFSNSYIVEESTVVAFLLMSLLWMTFYEMKPADLVINKKSGKQDVSFRTFLTSVRGKVFILTVITSVLIRLSFFYWQCREEQSQKCVVDKNVSKTVVCVVTIFCLSLYITVIRISLRNLGNLAGLSPTVFIGRYCPTVCVVCCGCYWVLNSLPPDIKPRIFLPWQLHLFPEIVFFTCILCLAIIYRQPLFVYNMKWDSYYANDNAIPTIFNKLKSVMTHRYNMYSEENPIVYGLATVYSATFINIAVFMTLILSILLGGHRALVVVIMVITLALLATILAVVKLDKQNNRGLLAVPWFSVLCWALSSSHFFYGTGHQASFLSIQWDSAGIFGEVTSTFLPGVLVILNTFASQLLHALLLPILFIMPFTLSIIWPDLVAGCTDIKKGEIILYLREDTRVHGVFSLIARYILFTGFRVFMSMFSACIHSRHLMVWAIFAPKFIFEGIAFLLSLPFLLIGFLFVERISYRVKNMLREIDPGLLKS